MEEYILQNETYAIRGCLNEVYKELGTGFLEKVYQEALEIEFQNAGIPYKREVEIAISYKNNKLHQKYIADFICYDKIIVELKAVSEIDDIHFAQVINYLKATNLDVALLVNFGEKPIFIKRIFNFIKNR